MEIFGYFIPQQYFGYLCLYICIALIVAGKVYNLFAERTNEKINLGEIDLTSNVKRKAYYTITIVWSIIGGVIWPIIFAFLILCTILDVLFGGGDDNDGDDGTNYAF